MRVLATVPFTMLRLVRNYIVLILLFLVPIVLLTFFSFILSGMMTEDGTPYADFNALTMVLVFQLFGGTTVMHFIHIDLFTVNRMRMFALPFNRTMYAFSIMMCGTMYSVVLGILLMIYSQFVLGIAWHSWGWVIYLITLMSVLSSIVCVIFASIAKNFKLAERLSELYGVGFVLLAGLFFPMPQNVWFDFLGSYGNPLTLAIGSVTERSSGNLAEAWFQANLLLAAIVILFIVMLVAGRRRMR
ncbi:ABC transporter permease [Paenibacillus sp. NPDC057967]|uniref:ABC transporter permease n=1 Tax=Paenibacillus sp. NPDC057967 TaxID=3346293 RepID=UPI0036DAD689